MKLGELVNSRDALLELNFAKGLDVVTAFKISKNVKNIDEELKVYEKEHTRLVEKYCKRDLEGQPVIENGSFSVIGENVTLYKKELEELHNINVEVKIHKIQLEFIKNVGLSPAQISSVEYMLLFDNIESED